MLNIPADIWMNMQTSHDLDIAGIAERDNRCAAVSVTIPVSDKTLLEEIVRKFEWSCVV